MTDNQPFKRCSLRCPKCNNVQYINRRLSRLKKNGHVKHLWCPICRKRLGHIEFDAYKDYVIEEEMEEEDGNKK